MKPQNVLLFILSVFLLLSGIMLVFPKDGIKINESISLRFISFEELFSEGIEYKNIDFTEKIKRDSLFIKDSLSLADSLKIFTADPNDLSRIQYPKKNKSVFDDFFRELDLLRADTNKTLIRVVHYGDSQIEGDRISGYLRDRLQELFGGSGAGMVPAVQPISASSIFQSASENWTRNAIFGMTEQKAEHNRYGAMLAVCSYSGNSASIRFSKSNIGFPRNKDIRRITIYYGNNTEETRVTLSSTGVNQTATLTPTNSVKAVTLKADSLGNIFNLNFQGPSPEIYGIAVDGGGGITVDNIPMRGSAGTRFTRVQKDNFGNMHKLMNTRLIIMEFGGNMMPSVSGPKSVAKYKEEFSAQLAYVKEQCPSATVITIGPSDMSKRINSNMQTYPYLEEVRDALKEASFENGCAYWDMFEAMGGKNSMPTWVKQGLAGPDYIHFTRKGAEKISEIFTRALIDDYNEFRFKEQMNALRNTSTL